MIYEYITAEDAVTDFINENNDSQQVLNFQRLQTHASDIILELSKASLGQQIRKIKIIDVENYKFSLPPDFQKLDEIAYKTNECTVNNHHKIIKDIYGVLVSEDTGCQVKCPQCEGDCEDCQDSFVEVDITPRVHADEYMHEYIVHRGTYGMGISRFHNGFKLMSANTSPFAFKNYHVPTCPNLWVQKEAIAYQFDYPNIIVNFQEGIVLLSYWGLRLDEKDNPMILGTPKVFETINYYLDEKLMWNEWRRTRSESAYKMHLAVKQLRLSAQALAKKELNPIDIKELWAEAKKHLQTRAGRPMNYYPFTK